MSQSTQTQLPQTSTTTAPAAQPPQIIQVQPLPQVPQPSPYFPVFQGDIGTFLVLIALTLLVKLLTDKSGG